MPVKYRILYLNHPLSEISGAPMSLLALLENLDKETFEPLVALSGPGPLMERIVRLGLATVIIPQHQLKVRNPLPYIKTVFCLRNLIRKRHVDLIHSNMDIGNQYGVVVARLTGIPIVCHTRNMLSERPFRRMFLRYADVLIAISRAVKSSYDEHVSKSQNVAVIHNGVDIGKFSPSYNRQRAFRNRIGIPDDGFVIGHIARICPDKGQETLIDAMSRVVEKHPEARALIVGDTTIDDSESFLFSLKQRIMDRGLSEKVILTGFVENIIDLYADLDIVVLPSKCEPFGRAIIEAMAMGIPVVATQAGGAVEVVDHGVTGLLVPPNDPAQLAEAILRLMESKSVAEQFGANGRKRVERLFSIEENVRKTEQIYLEVLQV